MVIASTIPYQVVFVYIRQVSIISTYYTIVFADANNQTVFTYGAFPIEEAELLCDQFSAML